MSVPNRPALSNPAGEHSVTVLAGRAAAIRLRRPLSRDLWLDSRAEQITKREQEYDAAIVADVLPLRRRNPELVMPQALAYARECYLSLKVEDLASALIDVAAELGGGSGDPFLDAAAHLRRVAEERGLVAPAAPITRRDEANRAIQKAFRRIGERDGFRCRRCGADRTLTVDHVTAVVNGGGDEDANLQILCRSHNSIKGTGPDGAV